MKLIPLRGKHGAGKFTAVDDEDYEILSSYKWYAVVSKSDKNYITPVRFYWDCVLKQVKSDIMSRFIMKAAPSQIVDHKDRNTLNNQKSNLRFCNKAQNGANRRAWGKSSYLGINFKHGKWEARLRVGKKYLYLGRHTTEKEAALAYNKKAIEIHGEFANLNKI